jgi:hypothetical protein
MEMSFLSEPNSCSATQEITKIVWNIGVYLKESPTGIYPEPDESSLAPPSYFFKIYFVVRT